MEIGEAIKRIRRIQEVRRSSMSKYSSSVQTMVQGTRGNGKAEFDYARFSVRSAMDVEALEIAITALERPARLPKR